MHKTNNYIKLLVNELVNSPKESEWFEFKQNNSQPDEIGQQISALANSVALLAKPFAYLVWGIHDKTHDVVGTNFSPIIAKVGNEELESWLMRMLEPRTNLHFYETVIEEVKIIILEISKAFTYPIRFKGEAFIKIGSYTKKLKEFPEKEKKLWHNFDKTSFEVEIAAENVSSEDVLKLLDYPIYFELLNLPLPENRDSILEALRKDFMISKSEINAWNILNLGAILFAKDLKAFKSTNRKALRIIFYRQNNRTESIKEKEGARGYASEFEMLIEYINNALPSAETINDAFRKNLQIYPKLAIRELIANALIHQDFAMSGAGPMVEVFIDRIEVSNPGSPLIETLRFIDSPPRSRNEALASFMRRIGVCEERGSGIDKIVQETETHQLPAPVFETVGENTQITLFAPKSLRLMDKNDRTRSCYMHACLKYVSHDFMTNSSLRERFGIAPHNSAIASRIIKESLAANLIQLHDPQASKKFSKYVPFWAK